MGEIPYREVGIDQALNTMRFYDHLGLSADYANGADDFHAEVFASELTGMKTEDVRYLGWMCLHQERMRRRFNDLITDELNSRGA